MNMRKGFIGLALIATLGGCTVQDTETVLQLGTSSISNPVTKDRLNQMESATIVVFAGLNAWKRSCVDLLIPQTCRQQIAGVQVYTRQVPVYLTQLRAFVKQNDQVNAVLVFNNLVALIGTVKTQAAASGQTIGS